jgi:hypothetical protein
MNASPACAHEEREVTILSVTPAAPGWGSATLLTFEGDAPELSVEPVAAWALVHHGSPICECPQKIVVPLVAIGGRLSPELPTLGSPHTQRTLLAPGLRPKLARAGERLHLVTEGGAWTPGEQDVDALLKEVST